MLKILAKDKSLITTFVYYNIVFKWLVIELYQNIHWKTLADGSKKPKTAKNFPFGNFVVDIQHILFTALGWSLYCLAQNKEHQEKCRNEVRDILAEKDSDDITWYVSTVTVS